MNSPQGNAKIFGDVLIAHYISIDGFAFKQVVENIGHLSIRYCQLLHCHVILQENSACT